MNGDIDTNMESMNDQSLECYSGLNENSHSCRGRWVFCCTRCPNYREDCAISFEGFPALWQSDRHNGNLLINRFVICHIAIFALFFHETVVLVHAFCRWHGNDNHSTAIAADVNNVNDEGEAAKSKDGVKEADEQPSCLVLHILS